MFRNNSVPCLFRVPGYGDFSMLAILWAKKKMVFMMRESEYWLRDSRIIFAPTSEEHP